MKLNDYIIKFSAEQTKRIKNGADTRSLFLKTRITSKEMEDLKATLNELNISESAFLRSLLNYYQINKNQSNNG